MKKIVPDGCVAFIGIVVVAYLLSGVVLEKAICANRETARSFVCYLAPWYGAEVSAVLPAASTRQGDSGKTMGLAKNHPKIHVLGLLDELNVLIGLFCAQGGDGSGKLEKVQKSLACACGTVLFAGEDFKKDDIENLDALRFLSDSKFSSMRDELLAELGHFYRIIENDLDPGNRLYFSHLLSFCSFPSGKRECGVELLCRLGEELKVCLPDEMAPVVWLLEKIKSGQRVGLTDLAWFERKYCELAKGVEDAGGFVASGYNLLSAECDYMRVKVREFERKNARGELIMQAFYSRPPYLQVLGDKYDVRAKWAFVNRLSDYMFYLMLKARMDDWPEQIGKSA